jgi:hypothetical protein
MLQEESVMLPHELLAGVVFFMGALLQVVCMAAWPQQYRLHRHRAALVNRSLRLLTLLVSARLTIPALSYHQWQAFQSVFAHSRAPLPGREAFLVLHRCLSNRSAGPAESPLNPVVGVPTGTVVARSSDLVALWKALLMGPFVATMHANWLVPFWVAVAMQAATFATSVHSLFAVTCPTLYFQWPPSATILPACQQLNWLVHAASQLLDWQVPVDADQASTISDAVCADPVVALVLLQVWVRLVLLVLVPCSLVYCLERSLKVGFLHTRYAGGNAAAASAPGISAVAASVSLPATAAQQQNGLAHPLQLPAQAVTPQGVQSGHSGSSSSSFGVQGAASSRATAALMHLTIQERQQLRLQQQLRLEQALADVQPASVHELLVPGPGCWIVRLLLGSAFALSAVLVCWLLCEVVLLALLKGGRQFVCGADGWLRLQ